MASLWCLQAHVCSAIRSPASSSIEARRLKKHKRLQVLCCLNNEHRHQSPSDCSIGVQHQSGARRRQVLFQSVLAAFWVPSIVSVALADKDVLLDFRLYSDEVNKFKIMIPQDWQVGAGESNGVKSVTGFYPEEPSSSNVTVVITGLGADFTRLESFGKVDAFAENLVSGLDRSWQRPPGVAAKLIDSKASNGLYYIEYTLQNPGESCRHLYSVLGMANNGWYNRLYTVTGQFVDEDSEKYGSKVEKAIASFRLI
ncbi:psbP domain-containing protein 3, chloroplastic isoform X2 [Diospyros lotus]|uniref:psbP domain-containing protein 3, chloroplastic isoform X2 n=1 Tax=Diospyros lotus TaxID=55363 RepID=UPI00225A9513|nr:psbP domain-containing protein 3, chloroplastic isoform X2 [Diospyros lotus]